MTAFTDTYGFARAASHGRVKLFETTLDFQKIIAERAAQGATALAAADTLQAIALPANAVVLHAGLEVTSAETTNTTATFDLGFTGGSPAAANVFADDLASNALGISQSGLAAPVVIGTSADYIELLINTAAPTDCVVRAFALVLDPND